MESCKASLALRLAAFAVSLGLLGAGAAAAQTCSYTVDPNALTAPAAGTTRSVAITASSAGCPWTTSSPVPWIAVTPQQSAGSGAASCQIAANPSSVQRTATLTIAGKSVSVTQAGQSCTYAISPSTATFPASGGSSSFTITAPAGCSWTARPGASWLTVGGASGGGGASGSGGASVAYSVAANAGSSSRGADIELDSGAKLTVTQAGISCTFSIAAVSPAGPFPATGGTGSIAVLASQNTCTWTAKSNESWITVTSGVASTGSGSVGFTVAARNGSGSRTGTLEVAGKTVTITQNGATTECTYTLDPTSAAFGPGGGSSSVSVRAPSGCAWTAASAEGWISILSTSAGGSGNGTVSYTVATNTTGAVRTGTMTIAGQSFVVTQGAQGCGATIAPNQASIGASGGTTTIAVTAPAGCSWTAVSQTSWLSLTLASAPGATGGVGNGTVTATIAANPSGSSRTGQALIAGLAFTVKQDGSGCPAPAAPQLVSPQDKAAGVELSPKFTWTSVEDSGGYDLYLDLVSPPVRRAATKVGGTSFVVANLQPGTTYYWRVAARGEDCAAGTSTSSLVRSFTTTSGCGAPGAVELTAPAGGATVSAPVTLTWRAATGAGVYDVYLGSGTASSALSRVATGITQTSFVASNVVAATTYSWAVTAHAQCDPTKTTSSRVQTFKVGGDCSPAGAFQLTAPTPGETNVSTSPTLSWTASASASGYDVFFGTTSTPALFARDVTRTSLSLTGLTPGSSYWWQVRAKVACDPTKSILSQAIKFTVRPDCVAPGATQFLSTGQLSVPVGRTYALSFDDAPGVDSEGGYLVERSFSSDFTPVLDAQRVADTSVSFVATQEGTYYHRVRAYPGCDATRLGPSSATLAVDVVAGTPSVVFSLSPEAVLVSLGEKTEERTTRFTVENLKDEPIEVLLGLSFLDESQPFFTVVDDTGSVPTFVTLQPRTPLSFEVRFLAMPTDRPASFEGAIFFVGASQPLAVTPYAFVSLKVGAEDMDVSPQILVDGAPAEYAFFPGLSGDDEGRPPITIGIRNPSSLPMDLGAEIEPELWLDLAAGWNATPIPPGETRNVTLTTHRAFAPAGSALPRYTYLTLRTKNGKTARLLVQDNDAFTIDPGRDSALAPDEQSYLIPSVVHATSAIGNTFTSSVLLSNAGGGAVQTELIFTPANADGFDSDGVISATILVPPNDVVSLTDPLVELFGLTPPVSGTLEVRAAPENIGVLSVEASVEAPGRSGGSFGVRVPTLHRGEGARVGRDHFVPGVVATSTLRTNLILAETTGTDAASVKVSLFDQTGSPVGETVVEVPRYGQKQLSAVVYLLGGGTLQNGRLELSVLSGGGAVVGLITVIDGTNDDAAIFVSRPIPTDAASPVPASGSSRTPASVRAITANLVIPSVVNGFLTFPGTDLPYTFQSLLAFSSGTRSVATFDLTYRDLVSGQELTRTVTVPGRQTREYANALEELFGLAPGQRSHGPLFVQASANGVVSCKVYSILGEGTLGDSFPVVPLPSESLSGGGSRAPLFIDGLEQSVDRSRGTRSNLILNEVTGQSATVTVRLYEPGNRSVAIAERTVTLQGYEKRQLSTVFTDLSLETGDRLKDRTNVQCVVTSVSGDGMVSAVVTTIDNRTGDTRNTLLSPTGGTPATGGPTIGF